jgi:hypothetical protein
VSAPSSLVHCTVANDVAVVEAPTAAPRRILTGAGINRSVSSVHTQVDGAAVVSAPNAASTISSRSSSGKPATVAPYLVLRAATASPL